MPVYEYECRKCNERFEVLQSINEDESNLRCPKCQAERPKKLLSVFSSSSSGKSANTSCSLSSST